MFFGFTEKKTIISEHLSVKRNENDSRGIFFYISVIWTDLIKYYVRDVLSKMLKYNSIVAEKLSKQKCHNFFWKMTYWNQSQKYLVFFTSSRSHQNLFYYCLQSASKTIASSPIFWYFGPFSNNHLFPEHPLYGFFYLRCILYHHL